MLFKNELYKKIPTLEECRAICVLHPSFKESTFVVDGVKMSSFKYKLIVDDIFGAGDINDGRMWMRGICFNSETGERLGLSLPKFFNYGEKTISQIKNQESSFLTAFQKVDGSLMSSFNVNGNMYFKTIGTYDSSQSADFRKYVNERKDLFDVLSKYSKDVTLIFEYWSPDNSIVITYPGKTYIRLLAAVYANGDIEYDVMKLLSVDEMMILESYDIHSPTKFQKFSDVTEYMKSSNIEGVVVYDKSGIIYKMKTEEYCINHRIISSINRKSVFEAIINGTYDDARALIATSTDDAKLLAAEYENDFKLLYNEYNYRAMKFIKDNEGKSAREVGMLLKDNKSISFEATCFFSEIRGLDYDQYIFKLIIEREKNERLYKDE